MIPCRSWPKSDPLALAVSGINIKKEVIVVREKTFCDVIGCKKWLVRDHLCSLHFKEKYGMTIPQFKKSGKKLDVTQTGDSQGFMKDEKKAVGNDLHLKPTNVFKKVAEVYEATILGHPTTLKFNVGEDGTLTIDDHVRITPAIDSLEWWREVIKVIDQIEGRS